MNQEQRKKAKVISGIQRNLCNRRWKCILEGCMEESINSHLLQQHGVLSEICDAGHHFYEIRTTDANTWDANVPPISFKRVGIKNAISTMLFCNKHDTELFSEIEKGEVDFDNYRNQLLFCLRTAYSEIRKKEIVIEFFRRMCNSNILAFPSETIKKLDETIMLNELGVNDIRQDIGIINQELANPTERLHFIHREFDRQEVYSTAIVSYDPTEKDPKDPSIKLDTFYFNVIPFKNKLNVLIGYDTADTNEAIIEYAQVWGKAGTEKLGQLLTGIFASKIENWGMSVNLYENLTVTNRKKFIDLFAEQMNNFPEQLITDFNLFENIF